MSSIQKHRLFAGSVAIVALRSGDRFTLVQIDGGQTVELTSFPASEDALTRHAGIAIDESGASRYTRPDHATTQHYFSSASLPGATETLLLEHDTVLVISVPAHAMDVEAQDPPGDIECLLERVSGVLPLPAPLAEPRFELRISNSTATAYTVKAGEYIQILDVEGRQCSDFVAFDQRQLDRGVERGLDAVTTRTLLGVAYPRPGLLSKFFDQDMAALVEVVRDTVGRHDTFNLACTAKYYADAGYPGHPSCSENFNRVLEPHGVKPRRGWPAINFFYNTRFDATNTLAFDEPWSRAGDYVLLRALTDLVCASSACPDDIDPANGWNPTDIHVRVYPEDAALSKGTAYRMTAAPEYRLTQETAFHPRTSALTRQYAEYRGYWLPTSFTSQSVTDEYLACRERVVVMDLSPLRKFEVLGPDAERLLQATMTRNVRKLGVGQVVYSAICHETGGMIDDGTLFRLGPDNFRWIGGCDQSGLWLREQAQKMGLSVFVRPSTTQLANLAVQGPKSRDVLRELIWTPPARPKLEEVGWFKFTVGRLGNAQGAPLLVSRTGYTGELGYEVWCHPNDATQVWDEIMRAGAPSGILPLGLEALDVLRIESGLIFAGYEFDDTIDPFEAGIGFAVPLDTKEEDFIGRKALEARRAHPQRTLVGLELEGEEIARHGDCVHVGRQQVGVITSGTRSPILRKNIALGRLAIEHTAIGTSVEVGKLDGHQKRLAAKVVRFPFYDPEKKRPRS